MSQTLCTAIRHICCWLKLRLLVSSVHHWGHRSCQRHRTHGQHLRHRQHHLPGNGDWGCGCNLWDLEAGMMHQTNGNRSHFQLTTYAKAKASEGILSSSWVKWRTLLGRTTHNKCVQQCRSSGKGSSERRQPPAAAASKNLSSSSMTWTTQLTDDDAVRKCKYFR